MITEQIEVAANVAPTLSELAERLDLLTTERDRAYQVAVDAQNAIDKARTPDELAAASDAAERASNRHETLYRAVERVEAEIAQAQAQEARAQNAREWAEYCDVLCQLVRQSATQKVVIEETALRVAQELEDRILNALDELAEAENAHDKTFSLFARMRADVVKHSASNPGQTYEVPARQVIDSNGNAHVVLARTTTDWRRETELFTSIITERGLSLDAMKLPEPNRNTGAMRFLLALRECQRAGELLEARYTQVAPELEAARRVDYASLAASANASEFLPPHILEQSKPKPTVVDTTWDNGNGPETHPELFQQESSEAIFVRQQDASERADQLAEAESQQRRDESNALLDAAAQPQPPAPVQATWREASAEVNW